MINTVERGAGEPRRRRTRTYALAGVTTAACALGALTAPPALAAPPPGCTQTGSTVTCAFSFTGAEQTFTVPAGVRSVTVSATGAAGGTTPLSDDGTMYYFRGGRGATVSGALAVTPRSTLYVEVGEVGSFRGQSAFNGGGIGNNGLRGGGGASDVRTTSGGADPSTTALGSRLIVAGAGGGAGIAPTDLMPAGFGGDAGADGMPQEDPPEPGHGQGGRAGTQTAGGAGGAGEVNGEAQPGQPGTLGRGGDSGGFNGGGGGGGGLYGGGGGGAGPSTNGGGGGGSSLVPSGGSGPVVTDDAASVTISYAAAPVAAPTITGIAPASGPAQGNTAVRLTGTGLADVTSVTVDSAPVAFTAAANGRSLRFRTPAHSPGATVPVVVTSDGGSATTAYTYDPQPAPVITGIAPATGPARGNTAVTATGSGFVGVSSVTVGGAPVAFTAPANGRTIRFRTPAHATGPVSVVVTTPSGSASTTYTYR